AKCLRFGWNEFVAFDCFILQRPGADKDYKPADLDQARKLYEALDAAGKEQLKISCLMGLPGSDGLFTTQQVLELFQQYDHITADALRQHLFEFLNEISPVAEAHGLQLAIHPDDPPYPILGLPRIMSTAADVEAL